MVLETVPNMIENGLAKPKNQKSKLSRAVRTKNAIELININTDTNKVIPIKPAPSPSKIRYTIRGIFIIIMNKPPESRL